MKKLHLSLDELAVESFDVGEGGAGRRGTVIGHWVSTDPRACTEQGACTVDGTCVDTGCGNSCAGTCFNTCWCTNEWTACPCVTEP